MRPRTLLLLGAGVVVFIAYAIALVWLLANRDLPSPSVVGMTMIALAIPLQATAAWLFGEQFRHGVLQTGRTISGRAAMRAALLGAGVARLLPVGGAMTPVAMSWSARSEVRGTAGPAVRATTLNYAGLLLGTGGLMLWIALRERFPEEAITPATILGIIAVVFGTVLLFGASRIGTLGRRLPRWIRRRMTAEPENHAVDLRSHALLWSRLACEGTALGLVLFAFGIHITPSQVLAAFGMSQLAGGVPGTPGGLGFAEAGLVGGLALFGIPGEVAIAPTLVYRLISYWLPVGVGLVVGGVAFLKIRDAGVLENGAVPNG